MKDGITFFYVLYSSSADRYYTGITTEDIESRVQKHNSSFYGSRYTSVATDWEVRLLIPCDSYSIARKMELYVKRMKSRKFIEKLILDPKERLILINKLST